MKKTLLLDMDGVLSDFAGGIRALSPNTDVKFWSPEVDDLCSANPRMFLGLEPIKGSIESVKKLFPLFDIFFVSTPMYHIAESYMDKRLWLEKHFGAEAEKRLILTHRKDMVFGHYIVDDTDRHGVAEFKGQHIHFATEKFPDWDVTFPYLVELSKIK